VGCIPILDATWLRNIDRAVNLVSWIRHHTSSVAMATFPGTGTIQHPLSHQTNVNGNIQPSNEYTNKSIDKTTHEQPSFNSSLSIVNETCLNGENNGHRFDNNLSQELKQNTCNNFERSLGRNTQHFTSSQKSCTYESTLKKVGFCTVVALICCFGVIVVYFGVENSMDSNVHTYFQFAVFKMNALRLNSLQEEDLECSSEKATFCIPFIGERCRFIALDSKGSSFKATANGTFEISLSVTLSFGNSTRVCIRYKKDDREVCGRADLANKSIITLNVLDIATLSISDEFYVKIRCKKSLYLDANLTKIMIKRYVT
jgi:hypothetical protein